MKRLVLMAVISAVCVGLVSSCVCSKGKPESCPAKKCAAMGSIDKCPVMSKLNLSDAQKVEVQKICDKCSKDACSKKACKEMTKELEKVLTPEQMTQYKAGCEDMKAKNSCCKKDKSACDMKSKKGECPMKKSDAPAAESK